MPMSRINICLLCALLAFAALTSVATRGPARAAYTKLAYDVSLQETPQDAGVSLAMLPAGVVVTVTGDPVDGYYPVTAGGQAGWVRSDALSFDAAAESPPADAVATLPPSDPAAPAELDPVDPIPVEPAPGGPVPVDPVPVEPGAEDVVPAEPDYVEPAADLPVAEATPLPDPALVPPAPSEPVPGEPDNAAPSTQDPAVVEPPADAALPAVNLDPNAPPVAVPDPGPVGPAAVAVEAPILAGPGPDFGVLGVASPGALVEQTGHAVDGYVTVRYVGVTGWVALDRLGPPPATTSS